MENLSKIFDVFFNGRPADALKRPTVTIGQLVKRGVSLVRYEGKLYRVKVEEVLVTDELLRGGK